MLNNVQSTIDNISGIVSPNLGGVMARKAQQFYDGSGPEFNKHAHPGVAATHDVSSASGGYTQSHRMSSKIRGHLMAYQ